jgi:hypothetical protein
MTELHPTQCTCQDCRSRRLIRDADLTAERYSADELEDFGYLLKGKAGREVDRPRTDGGGPRNGSWAAAAPRATPPKTDANSRP